MTVHSRQTWGGSSSRAIRALWAAQLPQPCGVCGHPVDPARDQWVVGHIIARSIRPDLTYAVDNTRVEHRACSDASSTSVVIAKAKHEALIAHGITPGRSDLVAVSRGVPPGEEAPRPSRARPLDDRNVPNSWETLTNSPWLSGFGEVPPDAAVPRVMTPPHPSAVGSYGEQAQVWVTAELGLSLRWWQSLALTRLLEHDHDGALVWRNVLVSTPRRAGKSVLMMSAALWRLTHGTLLGESTQTVLHTGQDLQVVGEVMRLAYPWATRSGFVVRRKNGQEAIEAEQSRWLMRSQSAVYGYEVGLGVVDEAWAVPAAVVDDGLEPGMIHRASPQLLLTSTAHRRATSLMRRRLSAAMAGMGEDFSTLVLWWAAPDDAPLDAAETWRAASPFFTAQQAQLIGDRLERAMRGEADPQADDPDALEGFKAQYLNLWPSPEAGPPSRERPAVPAELWATCAGSVPVGVSPVAAGIEASFGAGLSVALVYRNREGVLVAQVAPAASVVAALDVVLASGAPVLAVGKSMAQDAVVRELAGVDVLPRVGTSRAAVTELRLLLDERRLAHDASPLLAEQVLALMYVDGVDGPRLRPGQRADAVKAVVWAVQAVTAQGEVPMVF